MWKKSLLMVCMIAVAFFLSAPSVNAQVYIPRVDGQSESAFGASQLTIRGLAGGILTMALAVAGAVAIVFMLYGGYRYMTAGGNEEGVESAKKILTNAIIGLVVIILSYVILIVVQNAVTGNV